MLQNRSVVQIIDNTDVVEIRCFKPRAIRRVGDLVPGSVIKIGKIANSLKGKSTSPKPTSTGTTTTVSKNFKRGDVVHVLIVNTVTGYSERGHRRSFENNTGVIRIDSGKEGWVPAGTRIMGVVPRILRSKGWVSVVAMAEHVV